MELIVEHQGYFMKDMEKISLDKDSAIYHNELLVKIQKAQHCVLQAQQNMGSKVGPLGLKSLLSLMMPYSYLYPLCENKKLLESLEKNLKDLLTLVNAHFPED